MTFKELFDLYPWKPIFGCPGRWILPGGVHQLTPGDLSPGEVIPFSGTAAPDPVYILPLEGGGIISYRKGEGLFIHTLCDLEGFSRKLQMLGIPDNPRK